MLPEYENLPYRKGVDVYVMDKNGNFLIVRKSRYDENQWGLAGGGVDEGESVEECVMRELKEELGSTKFEILFRVPFSLKYNFPDDLIKHEKEEGKSMYKGQVKEQFLALFTGDHKEIRPQESELKQIKWVGPEEIEKHFVFEGQTENLRHVLEEFKKHGFLNYN